MCVINEFGNMVYLFLGGYSDCFFLLFNHFHIQGKKGVWIKLPIELVNLVETAVKVITLQY